ncbi:MAG: 3-oxoadipate enol-lactonase [Candidatus Binatia bacterium]|nr:MAG: 3-oxoadipate enol-lactonase [Candidatus Binatia bacterium]
MPFETVEGRKIFYELTDFSEPWRPGRSPILFLHGLGGSHRLWLYQVPAFAGRFPVLTLDLRNHGESTAVHADFGIADMALDVARVLRRLGVERVHVVGLSLGGMVALELALDFPTTVASLVLADTAAGIPDEWAETARAALEFIERSSMEEVARERITAAFSRRVDPDLRDYVIGQVASNDKQAYLHAARAAFRFDARDRLGELAVPTLVLVGEEDTVTPPVLSEFLAGAIPGARLARLAGCGHITNLEDPGTFNRTLGEFLADAPR